MPTTTKSFNLFFDQLQAFFFLSVRAFNLQVLTQRSIFHTQDNGWRIQFNLLVQLSRPGTCIPRFNLEQSGIQILNSWCMLYNGICFEYKIKWTIWASRNLTMHNVKCDQCVEHTMYAIWIVVKFCINLFYSLFFK